MFKNVTGMKGFVVIDLWDEDGNLKDHQEIHNLITTAGDLYYASRGAAGVSPANPSQPTLVTGMKLGVGSTTPSKSGAGAALVTYKTASNVAFNASTPTVTSAGADAGYLITYVSTWAPGVATDTALREAVIVNDSAANATSTAANTISRVVFTAIDKGVGDTLSISWAHKFLGA